MAFEHSPWQTSVRVAAQATDKLMKKRGYAAELGALCYPQFSYLKKKKPSDPEKCCLTPWMRANWIPALLKVCRGGADLR
jgi:hypothetical protein